MNKPRSKKSGFLEIKEEVVRRIHSGTWPPGSMLPTEMELSVEFDCARATVNRAMRELAEQGLVDRKRKSGTRVRTTPAKFARFEIEIVRQTIEELGAEYRYALVRKFVGAPQDWITSQLALSLDDQIMHLKCMHYADNRPFQFEERWINISTVPSVVDADLDSIAPNEWLLREIPFTNAEINLSAIGADATLSEFLATSVGTPLFRLTRTTWLDGKVVTYVRMSYQPGYNMTTRY